MTERNRNGSSKEDAKEDKGEGKGLRRLLGVMDEDDRLVVLIGGSIILLFLGIALFVFVLYL